MSDASAPEVPRRTDARARPSRWPGLVWAVPVAALLVVLYLGLQAFAHAGVNVVVTFGSAADAKAGDTQVIYKGLSVGRVTQVKLANDRRHVDMTLRLDPSLKPDLREGAQFWMVGANPSLTDITSVKASLAGVFIGFAPGQGAPSRRFTGSDRAPVVAPGTAGSRFELLSKASDGAHPGSSVFYHGQRSGRLSGRPCGLRTTF